MAKEALGSAPPRRIKLVIGFAKRCLHFPAVKSYEATVALG